MNRKTLRTRLEQVLGPNSTWGERIDDTALVWAAQATPGVGTLIAQRRRSALLLTNKRLVLLRPEAQGTRFRPLFDRPLRTVELVGVRRARPMVQVRVRVDTTFGEAPWILEFRPGDRKIATEVVDAIDVAKTSSDDGDGEGATAPAMKPIPNPEAAAPDLLDTVNTFGGLRSTDPPIPPGSASAGAQASAPMVPPPAAVPAMTSASSGPVRPEMLLTVLAMGDPSAVPALAEVSKGGFPPPPDPVPKVDRISVRNVANQLREGRCSTTEAQRWAAVVQRAMRMPDPPVILDPFDPFPDQLAAGILVLLGLDATSDPDAAAEQVIATIEANA